MRSADVAMAVPQILFALVCVASFGASLTSLIVIAGLLLSPSSARMARAVTVSEMSLDYYSAAIACGVPTPRLLVTEVLPNIRGALASQAAINAASAMILEAGLSFVGLGVQPPQMSWGVLLQQGYSFIYSDPSYALGPAIAILLTVLCLNVAADRVAGVRALAMGADR
jgi:ABC-type dipeptide/oligopeptide/nickel transport system permease subunit